MPTHEAVQGRSDDLRPVQPREPEDPNKPLKLSIYSFREGRVTCEIELLKPDKRGGLGGLFNRLLRRPIEIARIRPVDRG